MFLKTPKFKNTHRTTLHGVFNITTVQSNISSEITFLMSLHVHVNC